jgi:hypothetical protein
MGSHPKKKGGSINPYLPPYWVDLVTFSLSRVKKKKFTTNINTPNCKPHSFFDHSKDWEDLSTMFEDILEKVNGGKYVFLEEKDRIFLGPFF